jgi:hypothetical protein
MRRDIGHLLATGFLVLVSVSAMGATHYVDLNSTNATPPYTNWPTAATNIQDAVDVALAGDLVLVTNGVYVTGGRTVGASLLTNRVAVTTALTLLSVNGPDVTLIQGYQMPATTNGNAAVRCVYLAGGAALNGFTLTGGATRTSGDINGGGVYCQSASATLSNSVVIGNSAFYYGGGAYQGSLTNCSLRTNIAYTGGGAYQSVLTDCSVIGNEARNGTAGSSASGGGAYKGSLRNCQIIGNVAPDGGGCVGDYIGNKFIINCVIARNRANRGGGAYSGLFFNCTIVDNVATNSGGGVHGGGSVNMNNSIAYFNSAPTGPDVYSIKMNYSCTTVPGGGSNLTNSPVFVDLEGGDYRLQSNSPCINAGENSYTYTTADADGNPRIVGGTVDMGAYESQAPALLEYYSWLQEFGLSTAASATYTDSDGDYANNWQEWRSDTIPTNTLSVLRMITTTNSPSGAQVTWQSVATRSYWVDRATNLGDTPPFQTIASNLAGVAGTKTFTDTTATNGGPYFYRVGVQ